MTDTDTNTDQEAKDRRERAEQERQERLEAREKRFAHSATDNWIIGQEDFRRMMRTGEFAPEPTEPEPEQQ
jgi:hypothetical protein